MIIRSHEVRPEGYDTNHDGKVITVFSASNYYGMNSNLGAIVCFDAIHGLEKPTFITYTADKSLYSESTREERLQTVTLQILRFVLSPGST